MKKRDVKEQITNWNLKKKISFFISLLIICLLYTSFDHKGPLIYIINWIGRRISTYGGVWFLEVPTIFFTFIAIYKIARLKCGKIWSCGILLVTIALLSDFFDGGNLVEEYAMPLIGISLFIFLDYLLNQKVNTRRLIFCGFAMGGTCLLRINMISVWLVFCVAILGKSILDKNYKELRKMCIRDRCYKSNHICPKSK